MVTNGRTRNRRTSHDLIMLNVLIILVFCEELSYFAQNDGLTIVCPIIYPIKRLGHILFEHLFRFGNLNDGGPVNR